MQHLGTNIDSPGPCWGKEEQTAFMHVPLIIGTVMSHNYEIPTSMDNLVSCAQAYANGSMSSASSG